MTAWHKDIVYNPGEDEAELINEFVKFSALYGSTHTIFEIGQYVFRDLPDGNARGSQFGSIWGNDLAVRERIRTWINPANGETEREYLIRQAKRIIEDTDSEGKDKVAALVVIGRLAGEFKKETEINLKGEIKGLPEYVYEKRDYNKDPLPADE